MQLSLTLYLMHLHTKVKLARRSQIWWLLPISWVVIIAYLSFIPLDQLNLPKALSLDKIFHLGVYAILVLFFGFPLKPFSRPFYWSIGFTILFGLSIEFIQHYLIPNRRGDVYDVLANLLGVALGVILLKKLKIT